MVLLSTITDWMDESFKPDLRRAIIAVALRFRLDSYGIQS